MAPEERKNDDRLKGNCRIDKDRGDEKKQGNGGKKEEKKEKKEKEEEGRREGKMGVSPDCYGSL